MEAGWPTAAAAWQVVKAGLVDQRSEQLSKLRIWHAVFRFAPPGIFRRLRHQLSLGYADFVAIS